MIHTVHIKSVPRKSGWRDGREEGRNGRDRRQGDLRWGEEEVEGRHWASGFMLCKRFPIA